MAISTNPKPTIYRNLYDKTGPEGEQWPPADHTTSVSIEESRAAEVGPLSNFQCTSLPWQILLFSNTNHPPPPFDIPEKL